jgi:hypothetical protein
MAWPNKATQFQPGKTPNPGGRTKAQRRFEVALADALATEEPEKAAAELAGIVWAAVRESESWAVKMMMDKFAPVTLNLSVAKADPETAHMQEAFLQALTVLPDEQRFAVAGKLLEAGRVIEAEGVDAQ